MNARKFFNVRVGLTVTALALSGAMVLFASCAGSGGGSGGSAGNSNGGSSNGGNSGSNGGSSGSNGGSSGGGTCTAGADSVCFAAGQGSGVMTGYGWIAMGSLDSASSPKCAPDATDTTKTQAISAPNTTPGPCPSTGQTMWDTTDSLCISGNIPQLPASAAQADYDANWGLQVGLNATSTEGDAIGTAYSSVAISFNGKPTTGLRAELHIKGDPAGTTYCYDGVSSGKDVKLTDFNTKCWAGSPCNLTSEPACKPLTSDMAANIDKVGIQVSSTATGAITVDKLCLTGIQFKK
jgi:hypothetical protein